MSNVKALSSKLVKVMMGVKRVAKDGTNAFHGYNYVTEAAVLESIRENLAKENVFIFPSVVNAGKDGDLSTVIMEFTIVDGDTGEQFTTKSMGQGQDKGDKGSNKAITAATKYFFLKTFLIPTGDDPEATDADGKSTGPATVTAVPKRSSFTGRAVKTSVAASSSDDLV